MKTAEKVIEDIESLPTGSLDHDDTVLHLAMLETLKLCSETFEKEGRYDSLHLLVDSVIVKAGLLSSYWWDD